MALPNGRCFITQDVWPWKVSYKLLNSWATAAREVKSSGCGQAIPQPCLAQESGPKEQEFQIGQGGGIGQHLNVLAAWQLLQ